MSFGKKLLSVFLAMIISVPLVSAAGVVLEEKTEKTLVEGVLYTHLERLYDYGWQNIHIVKADLGNPHVSFDILKSENGVSYLEDTFSAAVKNNTVAAINGDFFAAKKGEDKRGSAVGVEIIDGELNTTPALDEKMNALYETDGELYFNEFIYDITITAPNGNTDKIRHINKYDDLAGIVMYNEKWNDMSLGATFGIIEVVVDKNNIILEKRRFSEPCQIPEGGYILSSDLDVHTFLDDNFNVGDEVKIEITTTPNFEVIDKAVSGGGMLVVDGVAQTEFSHNIRGYNPRTAVGVDESGKIMYFVVVEGRKDLAYGMSQAQLAELMQEIGAYNALNLDGGGSSLMAIYDEGEQKIANRLSDGYKRPVTNSLGIFSSAKFGAPEKMTLKADDDAMFCNTSRMITVSLYDEFSHTLDVDLSKIKWSLSGIKGSITDGMLFAGSAGTAKVTASYLDISASTEITVYENLAYLDFDTEKLSLKKGQSTILSLTGKNENGEKAKVYAKDTDISIDEGGTISGNLLTATSGYGIISAGFGSAKAYATISVDGASGKSAPLNVCPEDNQLKWVEKLDNGFTFSVFGNTRTPETLFDLFLMNKVKSAVQNDSDYRFFVGNAIDYDLLLDVDRRVIPKEYGSFYHKGSTFISMNNADGTIYGGGISQWENFKRDVNNADGNIFIFLNKTSVSNNEIELKNFNDILSSAKKRGCDIYVIGGGWKNETTIDNGVKYITTAGVFPSIGLKPPATNISYVKYLRVCVNDDGVSYSFEDILN